MRVYRHDCGQCGDGILVHLTVEEAQAIEPNIREDNAATRRLSKRLRDCIEKPRAQG